MCQKRQCNSHLLWGWHTSYNANLFTEFKCSWRDQSQLDALFKETNQHNFSHLQTCLPLSVLFLTTNCINAFVCALTTTPLTVTSVVEWCFVSCAQTCTMLLLALTLHTVSLLRPFTEILIKTNPSSSLDLSLFYLQCWLQSFQLSYSGLYCILL